MPRRKGPAIPDDLLDQLLTGGNAAMALDLGALVNALKKALADRALTAEVDCHLGDGAEAENSRNGYGRKSVSTGTGKSEIAALRDRAGSFDPQLIAQYRRRIPGHLIKVFEIDMIAVLMSGTVKKGEDTFCGVSVQQTRRNLESIRHAPEP